MMTARLARSILTRGWPSPTIDCLLRAIALPDADQAAAAWREFEATADLEHPTAAQFRLLSLAARRMAELAPASPMRSRIAGIERSVWSRSRLSLTEAAGGLAALAATPIDLLVIKGAGRAAGGDPTVRGRAVNDVDILIHPGDLARAYDILVADGWTPAGSGSPPYQRTLLGGITGINMVRGRFGNLDLHRSAFHPPFDNDAEDAPVWDRSLAGRLGGIAVRVPSPTDVVVIAIAHGVLDAHKTSDWLPDAAQSIEAGVDWDLLLELVRRRGLAGAAAIGLGYARERLASPVPGIVMETLTDEAARSPLRLLAITAQARPKELSTGLFWIARGLAKQARLLRARRRLSGTPPVMATRARLAGPVRGEPALLYPLPLPGRVAGRAWSGRVDLTVAVDRPATGRRIDLEVNAGSTHVLRLRARVSARGGAPAAYRFRFPLALADGDGEAVLASVPSRSFNTDAPPAVIARHAPLPFVLVALEATRTAG